MNADFRLTSARWQTRNSQTSFPTEKPSSITIYDPESHYENSRNQLRWHSTPVKGKAKDSHIEMNKKSCISPTIALPWILHSLVWLEKKTNNNAQLSASSLVGKEEENIQGMFPLSRELPEGLDSVTPDSECWWGTSLLLKPGGCWEQRRAWWLVAAPKNLENGNRGQREEEITSSWKRNWKIHIVRKSHAKAQRRHILRECLRGF